MLIKACLVYLPITQASDRRCLQNLMQAGLVNGSIGVVIGFETISDALRQGVAVEYEGKLLHAQDKRDRQMLLAPLLQDSRKYPAVKFPSCDTLLLPCTAFSVPNVKGLMEAERLQVSPAESVIVGGAGY